MLVLLDESFRKHKSSGKEFGVLAGLGIPEAIYHKIQRDVYECRKPYHEMGVLKPDDELHGTQLLNKATRRSLEQRGHSYHWNLVTEILQLSRLHRLVVFGVVCFRSPLNTFICDGQEYLDVTHRYLFERIDAYMKCELPGRTAKLVFDDRSHQTNLKNARAITRARPSQS